MMFATTFTFHWCNLHLHTQWEVALSQASYIFQNDTLPLRSLFCLYRQWKTAWHVPEYAIYDTLVKCNELSHACKMLFWIYAITQHVWCKLEVKRLTLSLRTTTQHNVRTSDDHNWVGPRRVEAVCSKRTYSAPTCLRPLLWRWISGRYVLQGDDDMLSPPWLENDIQ